MNEKNKKKLKEIKQNLIEFFKDPKEVISFFLPIIITICLIWPMPYYIKIGGGTIKIDNKINIEGSKEKEGSLEALYVKETKGIMLTYLLSYVIPSFEKEKIEDVTLDNEDEEDYTFRERLYFTSSLDAATKVAFEKAGKKVDIKESNFIVLYIDKQAKTNLSPGDIIKEVEGKEIKTYEELSSLVANKKVNDKVNITVIRDNKKVKTTSTLVEIEKEPKLGIVLTNEIKYKSNPEVDFKFNGKQAGPSGGLMISLSIYNKLIKEDITGGKKVVGTGTIDLEGNVGEIGGIRHKLMAADQKDADIVLVPEANYKEAKKQQKENGYKFTLISVKTFDDAIEKLKQETK